MAKFRKRPVVVEAEQYDGSRDHHKMAQGVCRWVEFSCPREPHVHTAHGQTVNVVPGDWIIREMGGRGYYPCKPDIFEATYEPVEDRCGAVIKGEPCALKSGHEGGHKWASGD